MSKYIEIHVGPAKTRFFVLQDALLDHSTFFVTACSTTWNENRRPIVLAEDDPDIFTLYLSCVSSNKTNCGVAITKYDGEPESFSVGEKIFARVIRTWALADSLGDVVSCNLLVDHLIDYSERTKSTPSAANVNFAVDYISSDSLMHCLLVDYYIFRTGTKSVIENCKDDSFPDSFLRQVLLRKTVHDSKRSGYGMRNFDQTSYPANHRCEYHQHDEDHPRCGPNCVKRQASRRSTPTSSHLNDPSQGPVDTLSSPTSPRRQARDSAASPTSPRRQARDPPSSSTIPLRTRRPSAYRYSSGRHSPYDYDDGY